MIGVSIPSARTRATKSKYAALSKKSCVIRKSTPASTFDRIYALGNGLINVAEAKPGDRDYNGGRWMVLPVTWASGVTPVQLTSAEAVEAYANTGWLTIASTPAREFLCPVIPVQGGGN